MKINIVTTHQNARQDEEYKQWISDLFQAAVRQFNRDSGTETEVQIQYREKTRQVRVFNSSHDFTYSVIQLTGEPDPVPGFIPIPEE